MQRTQILLEPEQHLALTNIARQEKRSLSDVIRQIIDDHIAARKQAMLVAAAQALLEDYQKDQELTAFQTLNGENFHAQG
jgi:macrodomain Ter protein organizer (MatP/YcbG family)